MIDQGLKQSLRDGRFSDDELRALAADLPPGFRRLLTRWATPAAAEVLVDVLPDREAARLLPRCGPATVRRLLPRLGLIASPFALIRRHPVQVGDHLERTFAALSPADRGEVWAHYGPAVLSLGDERARDLIDTFGSEGELVGRVTEYGRLAARFPTWTAKHLAGTDRLPRRVAERLAVLPDEELAPLVRLGILPHLPPSRRAAVLRAAGSDLDRIDLEVLPRDLRIAEASRRMADENDWEYLGHLPWERARAPLTKALHDSEPHQRGTAYIALLRSARLSRDPAAVVAAVAELATLRNERDQVRGAVLEEAARLAPVLTGAAVPALTEVVADTCAARSTSQTTYERLLNLALAVLAAHPADPALWDWGLGAIAAAVGAESFLWPDEPPGRRAAEAIADRLDAWVAQGLPLGDPGRAVQVADHLLRRRARDIPRLQERLGQVALDHRAAGKAEQAIDAWLADPGTRGERVARLLADDPSAIVHPKVWDEVSARQTGLLPREAPHGRFLPYPRQRWVPPFVRRTERWTAAQREDFVRLQAEAVRDADQGAAVRVRALNAAARAGGRDLVMDYIDDPDPRLAEAALGALVHTPDALPVLISRLDGEHASAAASVLSGAARTVSPEELTAQLAAVLRGGGRIAGRKEAARLLGRYGPASATTLLVEAYRQPGQHRDVRTAIVAALRDRLDDQLSWEILTEADPSMLLSVLPGTLPERHRRRYAALIKDVAGHRLWMWLRYLTGVADLVVGLLTDLGSHHPTTLVARVLEHPEADAFRVAVLRLAELDAADTDPGGPTRDRPARRRLEFLAGEVVAWRPRPHVDRVPAIAAAQEVPHPGIAARMLGGAVPLRMPELASLPAEAADVIASRAAEESLEPAILLDAAAFLAARGDRPGGLLAVAVTRAGVRHRWAPPWRQQLLDLREHADEAVREAAYAVNMAAR